MKRFFFVLLSLFSGVALAEKLPDVRQTTMSFIGVDGQKVQQAVEFENIDGLAVFEGDIILGRTDDILYGEHIHRLSADDVGIQGVYNTASGAKWPSGRVPFAIASSFTSAQRNSILNYMREVEAVARVQFVARTNESAYINIVSTSNTSICGSSYVGRQGGAQALTLRCFDRRTITHELMHALGFWHEQSRPDRDQYVTIHWNNITPAYTYAFDKYTSNVATHGAYDYASIMHYGSTAFALDASKPTISVRTSTPSPIYPPIDNCIPGQICQIPYSIKDPDIKTASLPALGGSVMSSGDKAALAYVYGAPLIQPYVSYASIDWLYCQGSASWSQVEPGLTYQLEQLFGSTWSLIYSGPYTFTSGIYGRGMQSEQFRVRALKNAVPGSWYFFSSYVPACNSQPL